MANHRINPGSRRVFRTLCEFCWFALIGFLGTNCYAGEHDNHRQMLERAAYERSVHAYDLDGIEVTTANAIDISLTDLMADDRPVLVHFIFTTCTTICPVQAATFAQVQRKLGDEAADVQMISVSIDPEYDSPDKLREYGRLFGAGPQWELITGTADAMIRVQKAFDAYEGNKMNHRPLTLMRIPGSDRWIRLEGLIGATDLISEYRQLKAS